MKTGYVILLLLFVLSLSAIPLLFLNQQAGEIQSLKISLQEKDKQLWGLLSEKDSWEKDAEELAVFREQALLSGPQEKRVYLSFDDGPSPVTSELLDLLKKKGVLATFFLVGSNPAEYKDQLILRMIREGHSIGNHSYSHRYNQIYQSQEAFWSDFFKMQDYLFNLTGVRPILTRFPSGSRGSYSMRSYELMDQLRKDMDRLGYVYVDWNVLGGDVGSDDPEYFVSHVVDEVKKRDQATVLFHDTQNNREILDALPLIIDTLEEKGYRFKAMDPREFYTRYR